MSGFYGTRSRNVEGVLQENPMSLHPPLRMPVLPPILMILALISSGLVVLAGDGPAPEVACPDCNDLNPCTTDSCDTSTGFCRHESIVCDDSNPCTTDTCNPGPPIIGGCRFTALPAGTACSDGHPCSQGDTCGGPGNPVCSASAHSAPGFPCDDGNGCTVSDACTAQGNCRGTEQSVGSACSDGSLCTTDDQCVSRSTPESNVACEGTVVACDDGDPCTQDTCNPGTGTCATSPQNCDDGNSCTQDSCDSLAGGCQHGVAAGSCSDGRFCTVGDTCSNGNCTGGGPRNCEDGVFCTQALCLESPSPECLQTGNPSLCGETTQCQTWQCSLTQGCIRQFILGGCNTDNNPCTLQECIRGSCTVTLINTGSPCNDQNPCTSNDVCRSNSQCQGSSVCDDANPCTTDTCDPSTLACGHSASGGSCGDGNPCNGAETCVGETCQPGIPLNCDDGIACTFDGCGTNGCLHFPAEEACDDGNVCTTDVCSVVSGCAHSNNFLPCDDGEACTSGDRCGGGSCHGSAIFPSLTVTLTPTLLSPADHELVAVHAEVVPFSSCGAPLTVSLVSITSDEPDDAPGGTDGHTTDDIQGAAYETADFDFLLRAERSNKGDGRTYEVTYS